MRNVTQHRIRLLQELIDLRHIRRIKLARNQRRVDRPHQGEHSRTGSRHVQVAIHRGFEVASGFGHRLGHLLIVRASGRRGVQPVHEIPEAVQRLRALRKRRDGEVKLVPVVGCEELVPDRHRLVALLEEVAQRVEIAQALGHLLPLDDEVRRMQPEPAERFAGGRFALGDFIFMVREDQVHAAGVDIQRLTQVFHAQRRAFDMPARPARPPRAIPGRLIFLRRLPQREVLHLFPLILIGIHAADPAGPPGLRDIRP